MNCLLEMHAIIRGNVQGVGFRAQTRYFAMQLGIKGNIRNLNDGSVEICAQGNENHLNLLLEKLADYFGLNSETAMTITFRKPTIVFESFQIM